MTDFENLDAELESLAQEACNEEWAPQEVPEVTEAILTIEPKLDDTAAPEKAIVEVEPPAQKSVVAPPRPPVLSKPAFRRPEATKAANAGSAEVEDEENVAPGPAKPALPPSRRQTLHAVSSPSPMPAEPAQSAPLSQREKEKAPLAPRNAFVFFCNAKRSSLRKEHPDLSIAQIQVKLGESYRGLSQAEKTPYTDMAQEDKTRCLKAGPPPPRRPRPDKSVKTAFQLFCDDLRPALASENPRAGLAELASLLAAAWKETSEEDKAVYAARQQELRAEALAGRGRAQEKPARALAARKKRKAPTKTGSDDDEANGEAVPENPASATDTDDDEAERLACDWSAHPPSFIISENKKKGHYLVARQGLPLTQYGLVSSSAAKLQRLGETGGAARPLSLELIARYEGFVKKFRTDVHSQEENGELDLEALPPGSALEACFMLGKLREPGGELAQLGKNDIWMKVPLLATCRVIQLLLQEARASSPGAKAAAPKADQERRRAAAMAPED